MSDDLCGNDLQFWSVEMSDSIRDESTPPGHGFAYSEPFPLDANSRIAALEGQLDAGHAERERLAARVLRRGELLAACRTALREFGGEHLIQRIDDEIGADSVVWTQFTRGCVPGQGGH